MTNLFFFLITLIDIAAAIIISMGGLSERMRLYPAWHKIGLQVAAIGLIAQAFRNIYFMITGVSAQDSDLPLWVLKDLGIAMIAFGYVSIFLKEHLDSKDLDIIRYIKDKVTKKQP